jgi:hypothetical protein
LYDDLSWHLGDDEEAVLRDLIAGKRQEDSAAAALAV